MLLIKRLSIALFILFIVAGLWLWHPLPENPDFAELSNGAEAYDVQIIRDQWGVPHIFGKTDADTSFGLAFAHAEDDFETIQTTIAASRGTLARYQGKGAAPTDYIVALLDIWGSIERQYDDIPEDVRAIARAYAAGLNLYAAQNPQSIWQGLAPFTEQDIVAGFVFKTPFFYGFDKTLLALLGDERQQEIALDPGPGRAAWHVAAKSKVERGSNAMAIAPKRSGDGTTRLLINSHQPLTGPVAWYEAHMVSEAGIDIIGGTFPGVPVILHGFSKNLGWANTVSAQDLADVYVLKINPEKKNQYQLDGKWLQLQESTIIIDVKLFGPFAFRAKRKLRRSVHGPVVTTKHGVYALRYAGINEVRQLQQYYRLNQASDIDEFMQAMAINALPSINYVYADKTGNIGFIHNAQYPDRKPGWNWQKYLPGDRSDLIWQGYRPFADVPKLQNPISGFIFNANNTPASATDGPDNLSLSDYPPEMGLQNNQTNRSLRIMELSDGSSAIGYDQLLRIKFDHAYSKNSVAAQLVSQVLKHDWSGQPQMQQAAEHLAKWDFELSKDSRFAALGALTVMKEITAEFTKIPPPSPEDGFREAVQYLHENYDRIDPKWGELNRLVRGQVNLPLDGGPDTLRAVYPQEWGVNGQLAAAAGDSWIAVVSWDDQGQQSANLIHNFGSATLDETSPHFADQAPLFADHKWRKALRNRAEIEQNATRVYRPQQLQFNQ